MPSRFFSAVVTAAYFVSGSIVSAAEFYNETLSDGTEAIVLEGEIVAGDEEKFRELSIRYPKALVSLESPGGALAPALEIGRQIRLRGYSTIVLGNSRCSSACALIWIAGSQRTISEDALVGFHASYLDEAGRKVESGVANALVGHYLSQLNLSEQAVIFATMAPPDQVAWLGSRNATNSPISFDVWRPKKTTDTFSQNARRSEAFARAYSWLISQRQQADFSMAAAKGAGAKGPLTPLVAEHLAEIFANDEVVVKIAEELEAARVDPAAQPDLARTILFNFSTQSIAKGFRRLPQKELNDFFKIFSGALALNLDSCKLILNPSDKSIAEYEAVFQQGPSTLRSYLSILRKSLIAEIKDYPKEIELTEQQMKVADNALAERLAELLNGDEQLTEKFFSVIDNPDAYSESEFCRAMYVVVGSVTEMPGLSGDWMRRQYAKAMSE